MGIGSNLISGPGGWQLGLLDPESVMFNLVLLLTGLGFGLGNGFGSGSGSGNEIGFGLGLMPLLPG